MDARKIGDRRINLWLQGPEQRLTVRAGGRRRGTASEGPGRHRKRRSVLLGFILHSEKFANQAKDYHSCSRQPRALVKLPMAQTVSLLLTALLLESLEPGVVSRTFYH